jgi:uncharacterized phage protein (TIGR02220 family)
MSNYTAIRELLKRTSGQDNTFTVPKIYVQYTGDLTTAILLNQIVFYSDKSKRPDGYFYKTYKEWEEEICLSERQVRYSINKLKEKGIIEANGSPTVHYKLVYDNFVDSILTFCQIPTLQNVSIHSDNESDSLTEITTENTTEITTKEKDIIPFSEIITYLNEKTQSNYKASSKKTKDLITARWNEGFTLDDFKTVINKKSGDWLMDKKMSVYLRPETLFGTKFESYLNQKGGKHEKSQLDLTEDGKEYNFGF